MSNYINNIPSSLLGYGPLRQQFQTYDGILSGNEADPRARRIETLQKRILFLEDKYNLLVVLSDAFDNEVKKLTTKSFDTNFLSSTTTTADTETDKTLTVHSTSGTDIVMNDRGIQFRGSGDYNHMIQYTLDTSRGFDGIDICGNKGGALGYIKDGVRKPCLDWGSERIRSPKTFQAGKVTTSTGLITVNFPTAFKNIPVVLAQFVHNEENTWQQISWREEFRIGEQPVGAIEFIKGGNIIFFIKIVSVSTSGFTCRLVSRWKDADSSETVIRNEPYKGTGDFVYYWGTYDGVSYSRIFTFDQTIDTYYYGSLGIGAVTFSWQAFDPTSTNIYTT
jgi:hypothetical protein